jgi:hypothetical protein
MFGSILSKDELGVPSTFGAILLNILNLNGMALANTILTILISLLSIVYLVYKIKNEKLNYDRRKDEEKHSDITP